jgi:hypothetical protein
MTDAMAGSLPRLPVQPAQRTAARVVGIITLLAMALSIWVEFVALGSIVIADDPAITAGSIAGAVPLVRVAIALSLACFISDVAVGAASYVVLRPVNRGLAALGALLRLANAVLLTLSVLALVVVLRLVSDAPYLGAFTVEQSQSLVRLLLGVRADTMGFAWVFLGLGQAVFAWLWLRSKYIPAPLAGLGMVASMMLALFPLLALALPAFGQAVGIAYMAPMFLYEVALGVLLLVKGVRDPSHAPGEAFRTSSIAAA